MLTFIPENVPAVMPFALGTAALSLLALWAWSKRRFEAMDAKITDLERDRATLSGILDTDDLTSAKSRYFLFDQVGDTGRDDIYCIAILNLDDFKSVNDGYGHEAGDALLREVAARVGETLRPQDFLARMGGDEFCIPLRGLTADAAAPYLEQIRKAVQAARINAKGQWVSRSATIGAADLTPKQPLVDALIEADGALRMARTTGRNTVQQADATARARMDQRRARPTPEQVAQGLSRNEIGYFVQPIYDIRTMDAVGVEALIRWITPEGDVRLPDDFLTTMTENYHLDMPPPLTAANAVAQTFAVAEGDRFCAFNISSSFLEYYGGSVTDWTNRLLNGLPAKNMVFEIVESAVIQYPDRAKKLVSGLREAGIRVALDDFGTGQSNLSRLREYPVDIVKIDRSFIAELHSDSRNEGILIGLREMGENMGFDIIAEGVETAQQLEHLRSLGIHYAQGYLLGRPNTPEYWAERLISRPPAQKIP